MYTYTLIHMYANVLICMMYAHNDPMLVLYPVLFYMFVWLHKIVNEPCFLSSPAAHIDVCALVSYIQYYKLQMQHFYVCYAGVCVHICAWVRVCECVFVCMYLYAICLPGARLCHIPRPVMLINASFLVRLRLCAQAAQQSVLLRTSFIVVLYFVNQSSH